MNQAIKKLKQMIASLELDHGSFLLFALFLREQPLERWDIVVAAPWLESSKRESYETLTSSIQNCLNTEELNEIARIVILDSNDPIISYLKENYSITNGSYEEVPGDQFTAKFPFSIKKAYLLRC